MAFIKTRSGNSSATWLWARRLVALMGLGVSLTWSPAADAQEILLTGPLAGAPAVRKLRLRREGRFEFAPAVSFTLLDEFNRTILLGARLNYNIVDWLALGVWGATGSVVQSPTALTNNIQVVNAQRKAQPEDNLDRRLIATNLGENFEDQLTVIDYVIAPQITAVPFRGKIALFQNVYIDTDLYFFGGPAFVGLKDRQSCGSDGERGCALEFERKSRSAIAPTFGLGLTFYTNSWTAIGFEWRALPYSQNTGGFDTAGRGPEEAFPDNKVNDDDLSFKFNQMLTLSLNIYLPFDYQISE